MRGSLALLTLSIVSTCLAADNEIRNKANNLLAGHFRVGNEHDQAVSRLRHVTHVAAPTPTYTVEKEEVEEADGGDEGYVTILKRVKLPKATSSHVKSVMSTLTPVEERPPPPDIRDTIRAVSPFLAAVIRHPLRYSSLIIRSILWAIWKVVRFVFGFAWVLLRPFVVPVYIATVLPVSLGFSLLGELQPLLTFLMSGTLLGLFFGFIAGYSNGFISDNLLARTSPLEGSPITSPSRQRRTYGVDPYARSRYSFGATGAQDDESEQEDDDDDDAFRASLRFPPLPAPYGRKALPPPTSTREKGYFSDEGGETETASTTEEDDEMGGPMTPTQSPRTYVIPPTPDSPRSSSYRSGPVSPSVELRRRTSGRHSIGGSESSSVTRPPLQSALSSGDKGKGLQQRPKAVRWESYTEQEAKEGQLTGVAV